MHAHEATSRHAGLRDTAHQHHSTHVTQHDKVKVKVNVWSLSGCPVVRVSGRVRVSGKNYNPSKGPLLRKSEVCLYYETFLGS